MDKPTRGIASNHNQVLLTPPEPPAAQLPRVVSNHNEVLL